ncbi:AraC family transcriptional regulator [Mucilaginibacter sp. PAMB04274]|uniref:AraC family transcriptional regulator n=1 Tax=Mucilaginibacter sp. PAMB04274 TaxID=3138568 RepID=UPI0031F6E933
MAGTSIKKVKEGFIGQRMIVVPPDVKRLVGKNELINDLNLTAIGHYPHASFHDRERKLGTNQYILLYCTEGKGLIELEDQKILMRPNTFFVIPKNVPHHYQSSVQDPWTIYWIHFKGKKADLIYTRYLNRTLTDGLAIPYTLNRIQTFNEIYQLLEQSYHPLVMEIINIKLLEFIASFVYDEQINPAVLEDDAITHSIRFMKDNIRQLFTVDNLAKQQNLSVSHYTRLFKTKTGYSPIQYFNQLKIQLSCQYLYFSDRKIKEICNEIGFVDQYYYSRLFRKLMGISPAKYKSQKKTA